jgi:hypothetical protein
MARLTNEMIEAAIHGFEAQKRHIDSQIAELRGMLSPGAKQPTPDSQPVGPKKRGMSAAGRRAIAEAQRKRWAAVKGGSAPSKATPSKSAPSRAAKKPKRKLSAAGRANIVAALKKRWAAKKAAATKKAA